jgi:hypothetical protein
VCEFGVLLLFGCLFVVLKPCVERPHEGKFEAGWMSEGVIHRWMDGWTGRAGPLFDPTRNGALDWTRRESTLAWGWRSKESRNWSFVG